jgi:hypothetical protein
MFVSLPKIIVEFNKFMIIASQENWYSYTLKNRLHLLCVIVFMFMVSSCKTDTKEFDTFSESDFFRND